MSRRIWWVAFLLPLILTGAGCRSATDLFNAYDVLLVLPLDVAPQSLAHPMVGERVADYTINYAIAKRTFPEVVRNEGEIRGGGKVLRVDGTVTRFQQANMDLQAWVGWGAGRGGVLLDVSFVDHDTNRIVAQAILKGTSGDVGVETTEPAIARAAQSIVRYLWWNKNNKPYDLGE